MIRCFCSRAVLVVAAAAAAFGEVLPPGNNTTGENPEDEDPASFLDYQTVDLTQWNSVDSVYYDAPENPNGGVTATTETHFQDAMKFAILAAFQATMQTSQDLMVNALVLAGRLHHSVDVDQIKVAPRYSRIDAETGSHGDNITSENIASETYKPRSLKEINMLGSNGNEGALKMAADGFEDIREEGIMDVTALAAGGNIQMRENLFSASFGPFGNISVDRSLGPMASMFPLLRSIMVTGLSIWFYITAARIPQKYV